MEYQEESFLTWKLERRAKMEQMWKKYAVNLNFKFHYSKFTFEVNQCILLCMQLHKIERTIVCHSTGHKQQSPIKNSAIAFEILQVDLLRM